MKKVKFFLQSQLQTESDLTKLEQRVTDYINSLEGISFGPKPQGFLDVQFNFEPNNNSSYSDLIVMVASEGESSALPDESK